MSSRRGILRRLVAASGSIGLAGCNATVLGDRSRPAHDLGRNPRADALPQRQHAWEATLDHDRDGNPLSPRHHRILFLDLDVESSTDAATTVEGALRTIEDAFEWSPRGVLHALAWGTRYFDRRNALENAPVSKPQVLSRTDEPALLEYDAALMLASDVPSNLASVESAMFGPRTDLDGTEVDRRLGDVFSVTSRRTGFVGAGLPAAHGDAEGLPSTGLPEDAPLFTGFFSGRSKTQATEERVTIGEGPYAGGTTVHISHITESLSDWWEVLDASERTARMFAGDVTPADVAALDDDVPFDGGVVENAREFGVVGHQEKVARVREDGRPIILRRDFNTVHGGRAGLVFVSLQADLADFRKTRRAMNGWYLRDDHDDIRDSKNNGILEFIRVVSRANFYIPPRADRAFPG